MNHRFAAVRRMLGWRGFRYPLTAGARLRRRAYARAMPPHLQKLRMQRAADKRERKNDTRLRNFWKQERYLLWR